MVGSLYKDAKKGTRYCRKLPYSYIIKGLWKVGVEPHITFRSSSQHPQPKPTTCPKPSNAQSLQNHLIKELTLDHTMDPIILQGIFLNYVVLESLGEAAKVSPD